MESTVQFPGSVPRRIAEMSEAFTGDKRPLVTDPLILISRWSEYFSILIVLSVGAELTTHSWF